MMLPTRRALTFRHPAPKSLSIRHTHAGIWTERIAPQSLLLAPASSQSVAASLQKSQVPVARPENNDHRLGSRKTALSRLQEQHAASLVANRLLM